MRLTQTAFVLAFPLLLSAFLACGGKVVVDAPTGGSGGGGTGGAAQSSSSFVSSTSVVTSSVSTATSTTFATSTSTGTIPGCDGTGSCQDGPNSCIQCAVEGPCFPQTEACQTNNACIEFNDCLSNCGGPGCEEGCQQKFPEGAKLYFDLVQCAICQACSMDCKDIAAGFCP